MDREFIGSCRRWTFQSFVFSPLLHAESVWHVHGISWFSSRESISNGGNFRCGPFWSRTNTLLSFFYHSEGLRFCYNHHSVISRLHTRAQGPAWVHWASALASSLIISRSEGRESVVSLISLLCSVVALIYFCRCGPLDHPVPAVRSQRRLVGLRRPSLRNAGRTAAVRRRGWRGTLCRHHRPERLLSEITVQRSQRDLQRS